MTTGRTIHHIKETSRMRNMRTFIQWCLLMLAIAATAPSQAQTFEGCEPEAGKTYYLWNVGQQAFLSATDSLLTLGGQPVAVTVEADSHDASSSYVFLTCALGRLSSSLFERPRADGKGQYDQWLLNKSDGDEANYTLANRYRETSAFYLTYSLLLNRLAMMPLKPASFYANGQWRFVDADAATMTVTLDEAATAYAQPVLAAGVATATVQLRRTLTPSAWNSLCVPFDIPASQVKAQFGDSAAVAVFTGVDATTLHFTATDRVEAGVPCLVYATTVPDNGHYEFTGITAFAATPQAVTCTASAADGGAAVTLTGSFVKTTAPAQAYVLRRNLIYHLTSDMAMKGFRAYFTESGDGLSKVNAWTIDGSQATALPTVTTEAATDGAVYDLQGQLVSRNGLARLPRGIYVVKGKKVIK